MFLYAVRIAIDDRRAFEAFLRWLRERHVADVSTAGGCTGEIVVLDGDVPTAEVHYRFPSRSAFDGYERDHAPRLRAEGLAELARIGVEARFTRWTGEIQAAARSK